MTRCRGLMKRSRACGAALITVLATLLVVGSVGAVIASHTLRAIADARTDTDTTRARLAAEAAVETARAALARDTAWTGGSVTLTAAIAEVTVAPDAAGDPSRRLVHAVGRALRGDRCGASVTVDATLVLGPGLPSIAAWK